MTDYTIRIRTIGGEPMLDTATMSLMFGIDPAEITATLTDGTPVPGDWLRQGRRRTSEAAAHTGSREFTDVMRYWARRDHNAELVVMTE